MSDDRHRTAQALAGEIEVWLAEVSYRSEQERAFHEAKRSLALLSIERAQNLFTREMANEGMLWLARALESIPPDAAVDRAGCACEPIWLAFEGQAGGAHAVTRRGCALGCLQSRWANAGDLGRGSALRLWDVAKGGLLSSPIRHEKAIRAIAFSPDGRIVATASDDGTMRQWDATTGGPVGQPCLHGAAVTAVCFSPDGSRIATASRAAGPSLWETATGRPVGESAEHDGQVLAVAFDPEGTTLALAGDGRCGAVSGDVRTERFWARFCGTRRAVSALTFSAGGRKLVTAASTVGRGSGTRSAGRSSRRFLFEPSLGAWSVARGRPVDRDNEPGWDCAGSGIRRRFDRSERRLLIEELSIA